MQDVAHQDDVGLGQRVIKETASGKTYAVRDAVFLDVLLEDGPDFGKVEADAREMRIGQGDLRGEVALRRAGIGEGLVVAHGNFAAMAMLPPWLMPVMAARNCFKRARIGIESFEEGAAAAAGFVLRQAGSKGFGEVAPEAVEA